MRLGLGLMSGVAVVAVAIALAGGTVAEEESQKSADPTLLWQPLPDLPNSPGVAGAFVGVSRGALVVAGGTNWTEPVWEGEKVWHDKIYVLSRKNHRHEWHDGGKLPRPLAGGATVTLPEGLLCIGGCDATRPYADVFLLRWNSGNERMSIEEFPALPKPCCYAQAAVVGELVYLVAGQSGIGLDSAHTEVYLLDMSKRGQGEGWGWQQVDDIVGGPRAMHSVVAQYEHGEPGLYVMGGRRQEGAKTVFLTDTWRLNSIGEWSERADMPRGAAAAPAAAVGRDSIYLLSGDDGSLFDQTDTLRTQHPGFARDALVYNTSTDKWESAGKIPVSQIVTPAALWEGKIIVASGETKPRVRSPKVWSVRVRSQERTR